VNCIEKSQCDPYSLQSAADNAITGKSFTGGYMKAFALIAGLLMCSLAHASDCVLSLQCAFADEYIRELSELQSISDDAQAEQRAQNSAEQMTNGVHFSSALVLAMRADIGMLKTVKTDPETVNSLIGLYQSQIQLHQRLIEICTIFLSGPKPGVDYGALMSEVPQIRAKLESTGKLYMVMSNLIFAQLLNKEPDPKGHVSRLNIDQAEREDLIRHINRSFGKHLNEKNQSFVCSGAWVLRENLQKPFTSSDKG
jgi:hypothetical protein